MKKLILITCIALLFFQGMVKNGHEVGDTASDFTLKNFDGKMISLSDYKNEKGVILIFDCNTCPYSQAYNERIIELKTADWICVGPWTVDAAIRLQRGLLN